MSTGGELLTTDVASATKEAAPPRPWWTRVSLLRDYSVLLATLALFIVLSATSSSFLTKTNLLNIVDQQTSLGIIACAGTLVIIAGAFDLSVGAIYALGGVIAAQLANHLGVPEGIILAILAGAVFGLINGVAVGLFKINPFIATLASAIVFGGLGLIVSNSALITVTKPSFQTFGSAEFLGVRLTTWIFIAFALAMGLLLQRTKFGRYIYACGGNEEAARLSGVRVGMVRAWVFVISGLASTLAGALFAARVGVGDSSVGTALTLSAVAAIVVGGTSIWGGEGAIWRTIVGLFFLALIDNGFNLLGVDAKYQQVVQGTIILVAAGVDAYARRQRR
ncbi:MAG TPA: ABC transporter permease [Thermoleophilaceae bacterium]|nr:ABC transporter permease [Thermoleophilaceae bacterium]